MRDATFTAPTSEKVPNGGTASSRLVRRVVGLLLLSGVLLSTVGLVAAHAEGGEVRLTGDNANNFFTIGLVSNTTLEFCTDTLGCFTRLRSDVDRIAIDGFDGDDGVFISHNAGFVSHTSLPLSLTFDGGLGNDELRICTINACTAGMTTDVTMLPESDEIRVVQCLGRKLNGARCVDLPFQAPVPTLKINARGTALVTDFSPGPLSVVGTSDGDAVTYRPGTVFRNPSTNANETVGQILVNTATSIRALNKDNITLDTGPGADTVYLNGRTGLAAGQTTCARDGASGVAPLCVYAGAEQGDRVEVAAGAGTESSSLTLRPSGTGRLAGMGVPPTTDLHGVDSLLIPQQPARGDTFLLNGTPVEDAFAADASTPGQLVFTGDVAVDTTIPVPVAAITLVGDGTGPLAAAIDTGGAVDRVAVTTGAHDDVVTAVPAAGGPCPRSVGACLSSAADGVAHSHISVAAELLDLSTAAGADTLRVTGDLPAQLAWRAGSGSDRLEFAAAGQEVTADLGSGTVAEAASAGTVSVSEAETWNIAGAGSSLTVVGTAGSDVVRYTPLDATSARVALDGDGRVVNASGVGGAVTLDPAAGDDTVVVVASTGGDSIAVSRGAAVTAQVGGTLPGRAVATTEALVVEGRSGDDRFLVSGEGGPTAIVVDGGVHTTGDRLSFAAAVASAGVTFDAAAASGTLTADGPAIAFRDLEHVDVEGSGSGSFTVSGSDSADTVVQEGNTVTVGRGTTASFTGYPSLVLGGLAGDDDLVLSPRSLSGVVDVVVDGGAAGRDTVVVSGTELRETFLYTPTGADRGTLAVTLAPLITLSGTEAVEVDGRTAAPSGDTLRVSSPTIAGTVVAAPGVATDEGTLIVTAASGAATSFPAVHYARLGRGSVVIDGADAGGDAADSVRVLGQTDADVLTLISDGAGGAAVTLDDRIPVITTAVHTVQLRGLDGQDVFHVPADHGLQGAPGPAIVLDGGGPSGGDVAVISGASAGITTDLAKRTVTHAGSRAITFAGLDRIDLGAQGQPATFLGGDGPDAVAVRPTAPGGAHVSSDLVATAVHLTGAASLTVDPGAGVDVVTVVARSIADLIGISRAAVSAVAIGDLLPVRTPVTAETLRVEGREGADVMTVIGGGGPQVLVLDGGQPPADGDVVRLVAADVTVELDDPATAGRLRSAGGDVAFDGFDRVDVTGDGTGTLTVRGTDAPDTITLGDPGAPAVRVNQGAAVTYTDYPTLTLNGAGGADAFDISYANLGSLRGINAVGGTSADDTIRIIDTAGTARTFSAAPSDADRAVVTADGEVPTITASGAASIVLDGRGVGDTVRVLTPADAQVIDVQPGPGADAGTVRVGSLVPITFTQIGTDGQLALNRPGDPQVDHVRLAGSGAADTIDVTGGDRGVRMSGFVPLFADGATALTVRGFAGADTFNATGPLPWTTTTFEGGEPANGDHVRLDGPTGAAVVDIGAATITGFGGTITTPEVSTLQTHHATNPLTVVGTDRDDAICYHPMTPRDGRVHVIQSPNGGLLTDSCQPAPGTLDILHTFIDVGRLLVDPRGGADQVLVDGTVDDDAIVVESAAAEVIVSVNPSPTNTAAVRLPVSIISSSTENVVVAGDNGVDDFDVRLHEAAAPAFTIHGEAPDNRNADRLSVRDLSGGANISDVHGDPQSSGTVIVDWRRFSGIKVTVNYTGIETVRTYKGQRPKA